MEKTNFYISRSARIFQICLVLCLLLCMTACVNEGAVIKDGTASSNEIVTDSAWRSVDDESYMVFKDDANYAWYQVEGEEDDNYFAGTYEFYIGEAAVSHLTVDLAEFEITNEEIQDIFDSNEEYSLENFVCMTVDNSSFMLNGEEQLAENKPMSYFGFLLRDNTYLDIVNMITGSYYGFIKD